MGSFYLWFRLSAVKDNVPNLSINSIYGDYLRIGDGIGQNTKTQRSLFQPYSASRLFMVSLFEEVWLNLCTMNFEDCRYSKFSNSTFSKAFPIEADTIVSMHRCIQDSSWVLVAFGKKDSLF